MNLRLFLRSVPLILILAVLCMGLSSCMNYFTPDSRPTPTPEVTREILWQIEAPPDHLAYYLDLRLPYDERDSPVSVIDPVPKTDGIPALLSNSSVTEAQNAPEAKKLSELIRLVGEDADDFYRQYGKGTPLCLVYDDVTLYVLKIPTDATHDGSPVAHAGKFLIVENLGKLSRVAVFDPSSDLKSYYYGRIGDRYHFSDGFYDLTLHRAFPYESAKDFPTVNETIRSLADTPSYSYTFGTKIGELLLASPEIAAKVTELKDGDTFFLVSCDIQTYQTVGDRVYLLFGSFDKTYTTEEDGSETFDGGYLYRMTLDLETAEILYLEKIILKNYFCSSAKLYAVDNSGQLSEAYAP